MSLAHTVTSTRKTVCIICGWSWEYKRF